MTGGMGIIGLGLAIFIMIVSGIINASYGKSLAQNELASQVMMAVAIFTDIGKAVSWTFFHGAWRRKELAQCAVSFFIFSACFTWSVAGCLGFVSMHRLQSSAQVEKNFETANEVKNLIAQKEAALRNLGFGEPKSVLMKRLEMLKQDRRYLRSDSCTRSNSDSLRAYCTNFLNAEAEVRKAEAREELEKELTQLREKRSKMSAVATASGGDFQSAFIAQLTGLSVQTVQMWLALAIVVLIESSACFFLWLSLSHIQGARRARQLELHRVDDAHAQVLRVQTTAHPAALLDTVGNATTNDLSTFVDERVDLVDGVEVSRTSLVYAFKVWCARRSLRPLPDMTIEHAFNQFVQTGRIQTAVHDGDLYLRGVSLRC